MSGYDRRLGPCSEYCAVMDECEARGDVIKELRTENGRLREALKPFAYYASLIPDDISDTCSASGTVGDLRAARKALGETDQ